MQTIIIVEPGSSAMHISNAIKQLGYEPVMLCSIREYGGDQRKYLAKHGYYEVDANTVENILTAFVIIILRTFLGFSQQQIDLLCNRYRRQHN